MHELIRLPSLGGCRQTVSKDEVLPPLSTPRARAVSKLSSSRCAQAIQRKVGLQPSLVATSRWHDVGGRSGWLSRQSLHQTSYMMLLAAWSIGSLIFLFSWDLYSCPRSLAFASACMRNGSVIRIAIVVFWAGLSYVQ